MSNYSNPNSNTKTPQIMDAYQQFLYSKMLNVEREGFLVDANKFHPSTKPHQRDVIIEAANAGRKGIGVDLNEQYWKDGTQYCREAEYKKTVPTLFDTLEDFQSVAS